MSISMNINNVGILVVNAAWRYGRRRRPRRVVTEEGKKGMKLSKNRRIERIHIVLFCCSVGVFSLSALSLSLTLSLSLFSHISFQWMAFYFISLFFFYTLPSWVERNRRKRNWFELIGRRKKDVSGLFGHCHTLANHRVLARSGSKSGNLEGSRRRAPFRRKEWYVTVSELERWMNHWQYPIAGKRME